MLEDLCHVVPVGREPRSYGRRRYQEVAASRTFYSTSLDLSLAICGSQRARSWVSEASHRYVLRISN